MSATIDKIRAMPHVESAFRDSDGYWVMYRDGVTSPRSGLRSDHEETAAEILKAVREAGAPVWGPLPRCAARDTDGLRCVCRALPTGYYCAEHQGGAP